MKKLKDKGIVAKTWVDQREILSHRAVGGFVSHCGWNSVTEAALYGVRILAWPQHGDQKMNARVVEMSGLGMWKEKWGWGEKEFVKAEEIGKAIEELMTDESLKINAAKLREAARMAGVRGGSCQVTFGKLIDEWKKKRF